MIQTALRTLSLAAFSVLIANTASWAQAPAPAGKPVVGAGEIVSFDAGKMVVKLKDGSNVTLSVPDTAGVSALQPIPFADLKKGDYIATAATKQANGTLLAREVRIFPEENRGRGEGYSTNYGGGGTDATMTNATVDTIASMDAKTRSFKLKYKDGEQTGECAADAHHSRRQDAAQAGREHHLLRQRNTERLCRDALWRRPQRPQAAGLDRNVSNTKKGGIIPALFRLWCSPIARCRNGRRS